jgi:hypothetical protein
MKIKLLTAALMVAIAPTAFAQVAAPVKAVPQTPEAWLARMTDMTQNMSAYKDPKVFVPWFMPSPSPVSTRPWACK